MADNFIIPIARIKRAGETKPFTIDFKRWLRSYWIAGRRYNVTTDFVRSPTVPGFAYQCTTGGEAGQNEPSWPRLLGGTVADGSITWTAVAVANNAVDTIASVVWSQINPPDGLLTISGPTNTIEEVVANFIAGTVGSIYRVRCTVTTTSGLIYIVEFDLEIQ